MCDSHVTYVKQINENTCFYFLYLIISNFISLYPILYLLYLTLNFILLFINLSILPNCEPNT
jgi:hypothetical protein